MPAAVYRMMTLLCVVTDRVPVGTNLGLVQVLWMLVSGRLLESRGALFPGLAACGLGARAVRRAWAALGQGAWTLEVLLEAWAAQVQAEGQWQADRYDGYTPLAVDVTAFGRPQLQGCPTTHYDAPAGKALPAIPLGLVVRVGAVGRQRLGLPLAVVRAPQDDPRTAAHTRALVHAAVTMCAPDEVLVLDAGFGVTVLQEEGATRFVVRLAKNSVLRRQEPAPYSGRGRRPTRGAVVRPLPRPSKGQVQPATPPDRVTTWAQDGRVLRAEEWTDLVTPTHREGALPLRVVALHDPRYRTPLLLATPLPAAVSARALCALYRARWPIEQLPLAAKQMLGASRMFVHAPQTCQRLPELALYAGALLSYAAATSAPVPTGFWDRCPQPTPGRFRRALAHAPFPSDFPFPARFCVKRSVTAHLPTGFWGQRSASDASAPRRAA